MDERWDLRRLRHLGWLVLVMLAFTPGCSDDAVSSGERLEPDVDVVIAAAAEAMGDVESVRFHVVRRGAPVFIDDVESIAVDEISGTVTVPDEAEALLTVTIDESVSTRLGAVAAGGETLLSNPVTGEFEPLPAGYDLDPRSFFDPVGGWRPLIAGLEGVVFVGEEDRGGARYRLRGTAPASRIEAVTAGLVSGQDVDVELWVHPVTALVTSLEFDTESDRGTTSWVLDLGNYNGADDGSGLSARAVAGIVAAVAAGLGLLAVVIWPLVTADAAAGEADASPPEPSPSPMGEPERSADAPARAPPRLVLIAVAFSVFVAADDLTVVSTMLRPIIADLGLVLPDGLDDAAWIVNVYLIAFVAIMPIAGRVSDVIGRRNTFIAAYAVFLVGTTLIPLTDSLAPFLFARVLTAIGGGAMVPVALAVVGDAYPEAKRARALGTLAAIETLGWVWGPMYGAILVRFLSWEWQFWLNIPLALGGMAAVWWVLTGHDQGRRATTVDWRGAVLLTSALVSLNLALLGDAEVQSVTGFEQLTGGGGFDFRWLYPVAVLTGGLFVWHQRVAPEPLIDRALLRGRSLRVALGVNFVVGAALVIAMVDVPIFINSVEIDLEDSAVAAGWVLSALTAAMAITSYVGGRLTASSGYRLPVVGGMTVAVVAYLLMGLTWDADTSYWILGAQLGLLGAGLGLVTAPTSAAVVDSAAPDRRGAAAATLMVVRLMGLSVGLSLLTAWGLARFNALRGDITLPAISDPGFDEAVLAAQADLTSQAIAETFLAAAAVAAVGFGLAFAMRNRAEVAAPTPHRPPSTETGVAMTWLERHAGAVVGVLGALVVLVLILVAVLFSRLGETRDDLARVEAGAALYASQVTGFQEQILELEPSITGGLDAAIEGLDSFAASTIEFDVSIDEVVEIDTEIVLDQDLEVPINETLPIEESFETTIRVETPLGFSVPLDVTVPVDIDVPVELDLDISVNERVPIQATVPVQLDVPIAIDVADTELANLAAALADGLRSLQDVLDGLGGG